MVPDKTRSSKRIAKVAAEWIDAESTWTDTDDITHWDSDIQYDSSDTWEDNRIEEDVDELWFEHMKRGQQLNWKK